MPLVREAASFEGLIVFGVIYFILTMLQKTGKGASRPSSPPTRSRPEPPPRTATQQEGFSLEGVLREIERVKRQQAGESADAARRRPVSVAPARRPLPPKRVEVTQDERGPLGRPGDVELPSSDAEDEATALDELRLRTAAKKAAPVEAERRREAAVTPERSATARLRDAVVWREILGPPVGLRDPESFV